MIGVVGLGYVGLTAALGFAAKTTHKVYACEMNSDRRASLSSGVIPFYEPGLKEALDETLNRSFFICQHIEDLVKNTQIIFLCVGTPCDDNGRSDLSMLRSAVVDILPFIGKDEYKTLVIKSTVPPSTTADVIAPLLRQHGFEPGQDIGLCNNPEFLREGYSWDDFIYPDRVVIGEYDVRSGESVAKLYDNFNAPVCRVNPNTGEFIKYLSNTLLATLISYSNEMSMLADAIGNIEIAKAFRILHQDKRWISHGDAPANMSTYAFPGCGFGGYCLPKDTQAIYRAATDKNCKAELLASVLNINAEIKAHVAKKVIDAAGANDKKVGILGLSYKPESNDVRQTPSADVIKLLVDSGLELFAYDPMAQDEFQQVYNMPISYCSSIEQLCDHVNIIAILTGWKEFKQNQSMFSGKQIIDARYLLDKGLPY